jgi:hypothetical protein
MSREYCKKTPVKKMGFSQRASCKSQGIIPRTSKKLKGKYVKSRKYISRKKSKNRRKSKNIKRYDGSANKSLYNNGRKKPKTITGYGTKEKALETLKNIKKFDKTYQKQVVNTMYNRAKYHKYQTKGMRDAMKVYKVWLNKN